MTGKVSRYPGAQPFSDDDSSSRVFFGRENASVALTDKILANRLVVVYARSGLGKTSLLRAGVAPRLREEGFLPVFARLNDIKHGPVQSVLEAMSSEAERQGVEFVAGSPESLWHAFKTVEFWRGDLMLTPVLILDQFEELFTLHNEEARGILLEQLSYLVRGSRPPESAKPREDGLTESPPAIRIVLSLREDYLGFLEDAADHIPQIFDARFRLQALDVGSARAAVLGPAGIKDAAFETEAFMVDDEAIDAILNYLSRKRSRAITTARRDIDPFQLQLVCLRLEQLARLRQSTSPENFTIAMEDIGGEAALKETLKGFYGNAIQGLSKRSERQSAQRLCEEYLISPEGRRLSLEEGEIRRLLELSRHSLHQLVDRRLLRTDTRSDSRYYELSHDALVEPVLAANRKKNVVYNWFGVAFSTALLMLSVFFLLVIIIAILDYEYEADTASLAFEIAGQVLMVAGLLALLIGSVFILRKSYRSIYRYQRAQVANTGGGSRRLSSSRSIVTGLLGIGSGAILIVIACLICFVYLIIWAGSFNEWAYSVAETFEVLEYVNLISASGIGIDFLALLLSSFALVFFGGRVMRWGALRLAGQFTYLQPATGLPDRSDYSATSLTLRGIRRLPAFVCLGLAAVLFFLLVYTVQCSFFSHEQIPGWLPEFWFGIMVYDCKEGYPDGVAWDIGYYLFAITVLLYLGIRSRITGLRPRGGSAD